MPSVAHNRFWSISGLAGVVVALVFLDAFSHADTAETIPIWPQGIPGLGNQAAPEHVRITDGGEHVVTNVHQPSITIYQSPEEINTGVAIVIAPGGGHRELWVDHEGHNMARWLQSKGVSAFVLKYRLARAPDSPYSVDDHALADLNRAVRLVRHHADDWRINPSRVGVLGFSAGGELAALSAMRNDAPSLKSEDPIDQIGSRPDFQALIYPGGSRRFTVAKGMPPLFIVCGYHDRPDIARGMAELYLKYKEAGVPAELHIYGKAGHGFGVRGRNKGAHASWPDRMLDWLKDFEFISP